VARTHITPFCVPSLDRADKAATVHNQAAMCAITTSSGCNGVCRLLRSAGDLVAGSEHVPNLHY